MGQQEASFDADLFTRAASLFASKRSALAPDAVETLAKDIVRRLASAFAHVAGCEGSAISEESLATFCEALAQPSPRAALQFIEDCRAEGVSREDVYLGYIGPAARRLGVEWDENRLPFEKVTVGTGHLYALMRSLRAERSAVRSSLGARRSALFATVPGEDHGLGITVAADLFREAGWDIDLKTGADHDALMAHIERAQPAIIGLSLSTRHRLGDLVRLVVAIRIVVPDAILGVALAATLDEVEIRKLVDIDLIFRDARTAREELERLTSERG